MPMQPDDKKYREARFDSLEDNVVPMTPASLSVSPSVMQKILKLAGATHIEPGCTVGLCPSCFDTGFVHEWRGGVLGVVFDSVGNKLLRCSCPIAAKLDEQIRRESDERQDRRARVGSR